MFTRPSAYRNVTVNSKNVTVNPENVTISSKNVTVKTDMKIYMLLKEDPTQTGDDLEKIYEHISKIRIVL